MAAKWYPFIKWLPSGSLSLNGRQTKTFRIIFDQNSALLFGFFICLELCCIHTDCITLESLYHAVKCLWECGDLQRWCCHGNSVRIYIYA